MYFLWPAIQVNPLNLPTGPIFLFGCLQVYILYKKVTNVYAEVNPKIDFSYICKLQRLFNSLRINH